MPRAPRIEFPGALYHVMNRGNHLERIFRDNVDRTNLLTVLGQTAQSAGWSIHSYCFMSNHYHLLLETHRATLVKGMQYLNSTYTRRYNLRHKSFGHLFQGRYKALLIDPKNPNYFLTVSDYIHLNPLRARVLKDLQSLYKDPWNSAGWIAAKRPKMPDWLKWQRVYAELGHRKRTLSAIRDYRRHLQERSLDPDDPQLYGKVRRGWCLGSEQFIEEMKEKLHALGQRDRETWNDEASEELEEDRASRLLLKAARRLGYEHWQRAMGFDRILLCRLIRQRTQVPVKWLAGQFGFQTRNGMSSSICLAGRLIQGDSALARRWKNIDIL
jgi:putative transposase